MIATIVADYGDSSFPSFVRWLLGFKVVNYTIRMNMSVKNCRLFTLTGVPTPMQTSRGLALSTLIGLL